MWWRGVRYETHWKKKVQMDYMNPAQSLLRATDEWSSTWLLPGILKLRFITFDSLAAISSFCSVSRTVSCANDSSAIIVVFMWLSWCSASALCTSVSCFWCSISAEKDYNIFFYNIPNVRLQHHFSIATWNFQWLLVFLQKPLQTRPGLHFGGCPLNLYIFPENCALTPGKHPQPHTN